MITKELHIQIEYSPLSDPHPPSKAEIQHRGLKAIFKGIEHNQNVPVHKFLGIKYANIPARFERAELVDGYGGTVLDATRYGPKCPQVDLDVRYLLRIPQDFSIAPEAEDEFECLNLDITCPPKPSITKPLPVIIWVHGGSQVVTFCSASSKICDPTRIVADSITAGKPLIFVSINYRLNIFSFGDGKEKNLDLKDQRLGIEWVRRNIAGFGGDPENITLAGESAGGTYTHAHLITGPPVKRAIMASGTLYLSTPMPTKRSNELIRVMTEKVQSLGQRSLRDSPVAVLLQALKECNINTMAMQEEPELEGWETRLEQVDEVMIGETEYESVIWRNGIELLHEKTIAAAFDTETSGGDRLRRMYQVVDSRPTAAKLGALDLASDVLFTLPVELVVDKLRRAHKRVFRFLVDQPNPWQSSSRAHHAVDLLFLFGGVDLSFNPAASAVGKEMRQRWIRFVNGDVPWSVDRRFAYGPVGECKEINEVQFAARRRVAHLHVLNMVGADVYNTIVTELIAGRISLLN